MPKRKADADAATAKATEPSTDLIGRPPDIAADKRPVVVSAATFVRHRLAVVVKVGPLVDIVASYIVIEDETFDLSSACAADNVELVDLLISAGANNWNGGLIGASMFGRHAMAERMLSFGANQPAIQKTNIIRSAFWIGCAAGHLSIVDLMISTGADDWNGGLRLAARRGSITIVRRLLSNGANDLNGGLVEACAGGRLTTAKLLLSIGATDMDRGLSAAAGLYSDLEDLMLSNGAGWNSALGLAVTDRNVPAAGSLISTGKPTNVGRVFDARNDAGFLLSLLTSTAVRRSDLDTVPNIWYVFDKADRRTDTIRTAVNDFIYIDELVSIVVRFCINY